MERQEHLGIVPLKSLTSYDVSVGLLSVVIMTTTVPHGPGVVGEAGALVGVIGGGVNGAAGAPWDENETVSLKANTPPAFIKTLFAYKLYPPTPEAQHIPSPFVSRIVN